MIKDVAYLNEWFHENEECWIMPYIEQNFHPASYEHQYNFMQEHLYFTRKIIENNSLENEEKILRFIEMFSFGKSKIITIIGGRGSGKTAFAMFITEKLYLEGQHTKIYYVKKGERPIWLPNWIHSAQKMEDVPNKSFAIIDETALEYGARNFSQDKNKSFTERLVILRHKDTSIMLITQHSKLIDINIRRLSDILVYKNGANIDQEGKKDDEKYLILQRLMPKKKNQALLEIRSNNAFWFVETGLPEFWDDELVSKTFKDYNPENMKRLQRKKIFQEELRKERMKEDIRADAYQKRNLEMPEKKEKKEKGGKVVIEI